MQKIKNKIADIILYGFVLLFIWIISNGLLNYDAVSYDFNPVLLSIYIIVYLALLVFVRRKAAVYLSRIKYLPAVLLTVFGIISLVTGLIFRVNPSWDMGEVFNIAKAAANGDAIETYYLYYYPNNAMMAIIYTVVFKIAMLFGASDLVTVATCFNSLFVTGTAVFIYFAVCRLYDKQHGMLVLLITLFTTPLYLQSAIYYTDSASMFFTSLTFYLVVCAVKADTKIKSVVIQILLGITVFVGFETKLTTFILIIALVIYALYRGFSLAEVKKVFIAFISFAVMFTAFTVAKNAVYDSELSDRYQYPPEHWIMMGLNGVGGVSLDDCVYTNSYESYELKQQADREMIAERLSWYNTNTFIKHITQKLKFAWTDGVYYAPEKLRREPVDKGFFHEFVLYDGKYTPYYKYFPQTMHFGMLILMTISAYSLIKCKTKTDRKGIEAALVLAVLGIALFLIIWENRSRYILTMLPAMMILQLSGLDYLIGRLEERKKEKKNAQSVIGNTDVLRGRSCK